MLTRTLVKQFIFNLKYFGGNFTRFSSTRINPIMSGDRGLALKAILEKLEAFAPTNLAESWDNVGLLMDPMSDKNVKNILLTNDLTEDVVGEAVEKSCGLIISYHPPIFQGMKSVTGSTWKQRLVVKCLRNDIAVFSPHTSWDVIEGGVNDWLAKAFNVATSFPITETGCGRKMMLTSPVKISEVVKRIKDHIGLPHVQLAIGRNKTMDDVISTVGLCAGSGATVLRGVAADLYLTGEMSHHEVLDAAQNGITVILCHHSNTERGFLSGFAEKLAKDLGGQVEVVISKKDKDPLIIV